MTIDNLDVAVHERWAQDQEKLDPKYLSSAETPNHFEIAGTSILYPSQWEELFEVHVKNIPWAAFTPPPHYRLQPNKFFTHRIVPSIDTGMEGKEEEEKESFYEKILRKAEERRKQKALAAVQREETALTNLFDIVQTLNVLLEQINARKTQYQKG